MSRSGLQWSLKDGSPVPSVTFRAQAAEMDHSSGDSWLSYDRSPHDDHEMMAVASVPGKWIAKFFRRQNRCYQVFLQRIVVQPMTVVPGRVALPSLTVRRCTTANATKKRASPAQSQERPKEPKPPTLEPKPEVVQAFCDFEDPYVTSTNYTESPQPPRGQSATTQSFFPIHRCKAAVSSAMHRGAAVGARTPVS